MKNKYIIRIICAIVLVSSITAIFAMMHYGNGMNRGYSNTNQISGYNNMMENGYAGSSYANHMNGNYFNYIGNNFNHMRYTNTNRRFSMRYNY